MKELYGIIHDDGETRPNALAYLSYTKKERNEFLKSYKIRWKSQSRTLFNKFLPVTIIIEKGTLFHRDMKYEKDNRPRR